MQMDLRTVSITPLRQTFGHLARRMGADKPASRYLEGTMDLQPVENFHYRPTWDPAHEIFDSGRTAIVMTDWYALKDPRQFYYATYTLARARMQEAADADFALVEELGLARAYPAEARADALAVFLPLRHAAWGANINNSYISAYGYGMAVTQAALFSGMDQLGIAQYLTRLGLAFDDIEALSAAKTAWLEDPVWQELRRYTEDCMVLTDWFEVFVAQNLVIDGLLYPLIFDSFNARLNDRHGPVFSLLTRFPREWFAETVKWVDAVIKVAAADRPENKDLLTGWVRHWRERAVRAVTPLAERALGADAALALDEALQSLNARAAKAGLSL